jgi:hypothetical protein
MGQVRQEGDNAIAMLAAGAGVYAVDPAEGHTGRRR